MPITEAIKARITQAMKQRNTVEKEVLRVALGEIQTEESRREGKLSDAEVEKIVRKLIKSNNETREQSTSDEQKQTLEQEIAILESLLPKQLGYDEVLAALSVVDDAVRAAGNDGQATGVAMKHLKANGANVDGRTVAAAVKQLRGN